MVIFGKMVGHCQGRALRVKVVWGRTMSIKTTKSKKDPRNRDGKKRPFQDDTALIVAAVLILIVAQYYYFSLMQELARPKKEVVRVVGDDVARAVGQDLTTQRENIEEHIKKFLTAPGRQDGAVPWGRYKPFFSAQGWQSYQQYTAFLQKALAEGQSLRIAFKPGSQKYAVLGADLTGFRADGLFCFGREGKFRCGPQGFSMQAMLRGSVNKPDALQFEEWHVLPPQAAPAP